jgi:hypothetical protein
MLRLSIAVCVLVTAGSAYAEVPTRYVGASFELSNGFDGGSEIGFAAQVAPHRYIELEAGTIRHDVEGRDRDTWLVTATARAKRPLGRGAVFAGFGVVTGEHGTANGCTSSGFIDFCGASNNTYVERHWERAMWLRPEVGGEAALGVFAARFTVAPVFQLAEPDTESGCIECDDEEQGIVFTMSLHGRLPL